jgi:(p)ppGpp synthase/HD superfamily hydrolase
MVDASTGLEPRSDSTLPALRFARRVHLGQYRPQTGDQFVEHPIAVAELLGDAGCDPDVIVAAYLHDVVEKTSVEIEEIRERFGEGVANVIAALSEDPGIDDYGRRKLALRRQVLAAGRVPILVYAADRVANMRDWRRVPSDAREQIAARLGTTLEDRLDLWREDLEELTEADPELPFLAEMELDLRALREDAQQPA